MLVGIIIGVIIGAGIVGIVWLANELRWSWKIHETVGDYDDPDVFTTYPRGRHSA